MVRELRARPLSIQPPVLHVSAAAAAQAAKALRIAFLPRVVQFFFASAWRYDFFSLRPKLVTAMQDLNALFKRMSAPGRLEATVFGTNKRNNTSKERAPFWKAKLRLLNPRSGEQAANSGVESSG